MHTPEESSRLVYLERLGNPLDSQIVLTIEQVDDMMSEADPSFRARVQPVDGDRFGPAATAYFGQQYWDRPMVFEGIAVFHAFGGGSSTSHSYVAFDLDQQDLRIIPIELPTSSLSRLIGPTQKSDPERVWIGLSDSGGAVFSFDIWNPGDGHNFPSGGSVKGTMHVRHDLKGRPEALVVQDWTLEHNGTSESAASLETRDQQTHAAYVASLSAKFRDRLAHSWHQSDAGVDQTPLVRASLRAFEELLAQWSPLGYGGFSRAEVESILGQRGRDEESENDGNLTAVSYWWDTGWGGSGVRIWYLSHAASDGGRAMRMERLFGR